MRIRLAGYATIVAIAMGLLSLFLVSLPSAAQRGLDAKAAAKPTPRASDGHPDLTGFYVGGVAGVPNYGKAATGAEAGGLVKTADGSIFFDYAGAEGGAGHPDDGENQRPLTNQAPYKPEYLAKVKQVAATMYGDHTTALDPEHDCKPLGVPRVGVGHMQVVQNPQFIAMLYEDAPGPYYRIIYTDGRQHPTDYDTSYMGHSIGHWDGDTLVVDTVGLDDTTWLQGPGNSIHSDKEHVIERWTRKGDQVTVETTVEDPVMFTKPWVLPVKHINLTTGDPSQYGNYILPAMCNTNDKSHWVVNDKYVCNWCNPGSVYGEKTDKLTVPDDVRQKAGTGGFGGE